MAADAPLPVLRTVATKAATPSDRTSTGPVRSSASAGLAGGVIGDVLAAAVASGAATVAGDGTTTAGGGAIWAGAGTDVAGALGGWLGCWAIVGTAGVT